VGVFSVIDTHGQFAWAPVVLSAAQLRNGQESWRAVADTALLPAAE
jgi:hypothetical protein